jgi:hypothetical protein
MGTREKGTTQDNIENERTAHKKDERCLPPPILELGLDRVHPRLTTLAATELTETIDKPGTKQQKQEEDKMYGGGTH